MGPRKKKLPQNAFRYYAQMYYQRKHTIESRYSHPMLEVYKSWHSLSELEKQQFYSQYNEYKIKHNQVLADRLKEAKPFMKKISEPNRKINQSSKNSSTVITDEQSDMIVEALTSKTEECENISPIDKAESECSNQQICDNDKTSDYENQTETDRHVTQLDITEQGATTGGGEDLQTEYIITEPAPPTVKNGKELYCMLDEDNCTPWASLPQKSKKQYGRAVYVLKRDYITKYKKYLESLTPRELFDYYNKKIF